MASVFTIEKENLFVIFDKIILFSLAVLIIVLPIAHTATIRSIAIFLPIGLWLLKIAINKKIEFTTTPLDIPIMLYFLTGLISIFSAVDPSYTLRAIRSDMLVPFLLFYLTINNIKREDDVKILFIILCIGAIIMTVYGICDFFIKGGTFVTDAYRARSLYAEFNYFATYLIIVPPFFILGLFFFKKWKYRLFFIFLNLLTLFSLYITHTRGAWIALYVELVFIIFIMIKRKWIPIILASIMVLFALLVIPKRALYHEETLGHGTGVESSTASRRATWQFSFKEIAKSPFIGIGFGRDSFLKKYANHPENKYKLAHSHNAFIDLTLQLGIQGLLAFFFIIYILNKTLWIKIKESREDFCRFFALATFVMIAGYLVRNLFDSFLIDDSLLMFWLLNGITIALMKADNDNYLSCS